MKNRLFSIAAMTGLLLFAAMTLLKAGEHPSFHVEVRGHGQPVILIPGLACSGEVWNKTVDRYEGRYECHVLTLAGFAGVPPIEKDLLTTVSRELADYIRENKLDRPVVIGHSLGGIVALSVASSEPDLTGPLVIVDALPFLPAVWMPNATPDSTRAQAEKTRDRMAQQSRNQYRQSGPTILRTMISDTNYVQVALQWGLASDPKTVGRAMYEVMTTDLRQKLADIKVSVVVLGTWIAGQAYGATPENTKQNFILQYQKLRACDIRIAERARHFIMADDPNWFFAQLDEAFKKSVR